MKLSPSIAFHKTWLHGNSFEFLNLRHDFKEKIDWEFAQYGKLWTYNLNYFEFLNQPGFPKEKAWELMLDYIANYQALKTGFEPFPCSLRLISWIKYLESNQIHDSKINDFLYTSANNLTQDLEYHLLGNHLLENGFALYFAAGWFGEAKFLKPAEKILSAELNEQIMEDGAHFERSPMYHSLMLFRLLDCINLAQQNQGFSGAGLLPFFLEKAGRMLGWLQAMAWQDGSLPLLNDSANGIAPSPDALFGYASQLGVAPIKTNLKDSGYRKLAGPQYELLLDIGEVGPDYIPGHAHSDTLGFLMQVAQQPFIVDTGISTYEKNQVRQWERSTAAHNTVQLNDWEQSEIWGGFRVGDRARPQVLEDTPHEISASHDGFARRGGQHRRTWKMEADRVCVTDTVQSPAGTQAKAFFHFDPSIEILASNDPKTINTSLWRLTFDGAERILVEDFQCAGNYNQCVPSKKLTVYFQTQLQTIIQK
ncbi:MAG: alginate lyase family protein [Saprospiraceae bacterium]|nr:alginate lyase family protein [Saprospiraceae bacterium]